MPKITKIGQDLQLPKLLTSLLPRFYGPRLQTSTTVQGPLVAKGLPGDCSRILDTFPDGQATNDAITLTNAKKYNYSV